MLPEPEQLWSVQELCARLRVARSTVYDWVSQGFIPHVRLVGCVRFRPSEIATWIDRQAKPGHSSRVPEGRYEAHKQRRQQRGNVIGVRG